MTESTPKHALRSTKMVVFEDADHHDESVVAILIQRDASDGRTKVFVKEYPGNRAPDPEVVAVLKQAVDLANL